MLASARKHVSLFLEYILATDEMFFFSCIGDTQSVHRPKGKEEDCWVASICSRVSLKSSMNGAFKWGMQQLAVLADRVVVPPSSAPSERRWYSTEERLCQKIGTWERSGEPGIVPTLRKDRSGYFGEPVGDSPGG